MAVHIYIGFWTLKVKCTQYEICSQAAFKNARAIFFSKFGGAGNNFPSGSKFSQEGYPRPNLTPPIVRRGGLDVRPSSISYLSLMCSIFVIGHLYLSTIWHKLLLETATRKTHLATIVCSVLQILYLFDRWTQLEGPMWSFKREDYITILDVDDQNTSYVLILPTTSIYIACGTNSWPLQLRTRGIFQPTSNCWCVQRDNINCGLIVE